MTANEHLMTALDLARLDRERAARDAAKYRPARCRHCGGLFTPAPRFPHQRYCSAAHRRLAWQYARAKLLGEIVQARRQESAPVACGHCGRPLPPPGKTGVLRRYHDSCRSLRCRARKETG